MVLDAPGSARAVMDYEIGVTGPIPDGTLSNVDGVVVAVQPEATILSGAVADQAALHGLINRLHVAGLELLEVRRAARPSAGPPGQQRPGCGCPPPTDEHALPERYELGVTGRIGPLIRSCLPQFTETVENESTVLTGTARCPEDLHRMLDLLTTHGLTSQEIRLTHHTDTTPPRNPGPNPAPAADTDRSTSTSPPDRANAVSGANRTAQKECSGR
jgi:hypothetical protein